jgi:ArsR family transcriptional regulator
MKASQAIDALAALAQESRLSIFRLLVRHAPQGLAAGDIAKRLRLPNPTLSFHLNILAAADLIRPNRNGRSIRYSPALDQVNGLTQFLLENCCAATGCCDPAPTVPRKKAPRKR